MLAPYENENELPREFWTGPVGPSEWRQRDVSVFKWFGTI